MGWPMHDMRGAIENAIGWLDDALKDATEDPDCDWKALDDYAARIGAVLAQARTLLPMPEELELAYRHEEHEIDDGADRAEALRG